MPREAWSYALLLIILCTIASIAVWQTIAYLAEGLPEHEFRVAAAALWSLTLGFMLIAGAFGLWATQFAAAAETRRRISKMVAAMDYIRDAVVAIDSKGRVTGANPAAEALAETGPLHGRLLSSLFPCISDRDVLLLTNPRTPNEIERRYVHRSTPSVLRFRSQPSKNVSMVIVSDITTMNEQQANGRQAAQLQLVGEISKGVAHDFNALLCEISGHASLLRRLVPAPSALQTSTKAIIDASERGVVLSGQLIELARATPQPTASQHPEVYVRKAAAALRNMLSEHWQVEIDIEDLPLLSVTGPQLQQITLNLGLLAADSLHHPGLLTLAGRLDDAGAENAPPAGPGAVLEIRAVRQDTPRVDFEPAEEERTGTGAIQSVIRSLLMEMHGSLTTLRGPYGAVLYRIALPQGQIRPTRTPDEEFPQELASYVAGWTALLVTPHREFSPIEARMRDVNMIVQRTNNIVSTLAHIEEHAYDAILIDEHVMEQESQGILRAVMKLQPAAGLVVLCDNPHTPPDPIARDVRFLPYDADPNTVMHAMVEAKSLGVRRLAQRT